VVVLVGETERLLPGVLDKEVVPLGQDPSCQYIIVALVDVAEMLVELPEQIVVAPEAEGLPGVAQGTEYR